MGRRARQDPFADENRSRKNSPSASLGEVGVLSGGRVSCPAVVGVLCPFNFILRFGTHMTALCLF